ncbi:MAG: single-stranded DNA-binding protein [Ruminococcaceae bacterium]|nr:single-stranded DNA-binding protein [Oscillospiraceae bacterium]
MSLNLNKVILAGRLVADPELKQTTGGANVVSVRMAVNRRFQSRDAQQQNEADFFNVTAWQNTAEFIAKYFRKGSAICICGRIQNRTWVDQNGQKRYTTDIIAEEANFVESRNAQDSMPGMGAPDAFSAPAYSSAPMSAPKFEEIKTDDDLPF